MPESKSQARARAQKRHIPVSQVVKGKSGYYIAPRGMESRAGKKTYAMLRSSGHGKKYSAKVAWSVAKGDGQ